LTVHLAARGDEVRFKLGRPEVDADRLAIRGSSMGGHYAVHAGATCPALKAVVAICTSSEADPKYQGGSYETD
jgi:dienelactone hydrolase